MEMGLGNWHIAGKVLPNKLIVHVAYIVLIMSERIRDQDEDAIDAFERDFEVRCGESREVGADAHGENFLKMEWWCVVACFLKRRGREKLESIDFPLQNAC